MPETHGRSEVVYTTEKEFPITIGDKNFNIGILRPLSADEMNNRRSEIEEHYKWIGVSQDDLNKSIEKDWDFS